MNILIVDDSEENRYLLESMLKAHGHTVLSSPNGQEALEVFRSEMIDLIISDILMPVMDGFQFCRAVKTNEALRSIPFVIYTATYTSAKDEDLALQMGADRFLVKPCEPDVFMATINELVANHSKTEPGETAVPAENEDSVFKLYNEQLVKKLEKKMLEAEQEVAARHEAERALRTSEKRLLAAQRIAGMGDFTWEIETGVVTWSEPMYELLGYDSSEPIDWQKMRSIINTPEGQVPIEIWLAQCTAFGRQKYGPKYYRLICRDNRVIDVQMFVSVTYENRTPIEIFGTVQDITQQKAAEEERQKLQAQFTQAQKMESVGRLAGGVAHDFNNKLTIINGYAEMAIDMMDPSDPLRETIQEIYTAGKKSADIVRQLLAFARKQTFSPVLLDLNDTISRMLKMLQRLIGENIDLTWHPGNNLWSVKIDPSQVDQVMANLAVNSRDAISDVGKLTIETKNTIVDEDYCKSDPEATPGQYVMLSVSDSGSGMDRETLENLFEPFFTTKEIGKGTGLGLPTVYGIVKQNNGFINVYSEPGEGTIFKIYLPRHEEQESPALEHLKEFAEQRPTGSETILLVEDARSVLHMGRVLLEKLGYTVLTAEAPNDALQLAEEYAGRIQLLITDVIMPEMNGRDLAMRINLLRPEIKTIYISSYTKSVIAHLGVLDNGVHYIQKPFSMQELAVKVREVIEQE